MRMNTAAGIIADAQNFSHESAFYDIAGLYFTRIIVSVTLATHCYLLLELVYGL